MKLGGEELLWSKVEFIVCMFREQTKETVELFTGLKQTVKNLWQSNAGLVCIDLTHLST